jgi:hypothetical protein
MPGCAGMGLRNQLKIPFFGFRYYNTILIQLCDAGKSITSILQMSDKSMLSGTETSVIIQIIYYDILSKLDLSVVLLTPYNVSSFDPSSLFNNSPSLSSDVIIMRASKVNIF